MHAMLEQHGDGDLRFFVRGEGDGKCVIPELVGHLPLVVPRLHSPQGTGLPATPTSERRAMPPVPCDSFQYGVALIGMADLR